MEYISSLFNSHCSPSDTQPSNNNRGSKQREDLVDHQVSCCPSSSVLVSSARQLLHNGWAIRLHKDILELRPHPQSDAVRPAEPCLNDVLTSPARAVAIQRRELLEEVTVLANGLRQIERGVRQAGEQAWKRATRRIPAAIYASHVPICELTLQLGGPTLSLDLVSSIRNGSVDCIDIRATGRSATTTKSLEGYLVLC
jgi:hypothetical protein